MRCTLMRDREMPTVRARHEMHASEYTPMRHTPVRHAGEYTPTRDTSGDTRR